MLKAVLLGAALLSALILPARAQTPANTPGLTPEMDRLLMKGIDDIYRMHFDDADADARKAMAIDPYYPYPYFGLAGAYWTRYVFETDRTDLSLLPPFQDNVEKTITLSQQWLKVHPGDAHVLMVLGAAYGISSRLDVVRREWIQAYFDGRRALYYTKQAVKQDPTFWDAYLGLGMYDYYSDLYPRFIGVLAKLVLRGSQTRGIATLRMVAEKGHFAKVTAQLLLVEIDTENQFGHRDPEEALRIMDALHARYPDSHGMHSARLVAYYEDKRYDVVVDGARDYIELAKKGVYPSVEQAKGYDFLGTALWALGDKEKALEAFREATHIMYKGHLNRWAVWGLVRAGNIEDTMGLRHDALRDYYAAAAEPDLWEIRPIAKSWIAHPFTSTYPGPIPPP